VVDGVAYHVRGAIGTGIGAWSRSAKIRDNLGLKKLPKGLPLKEWDALSKDYFIMEVS
jgi:hypothetical protein